MDATIKTLRALNQPVPKPMALPTEKTILKIEKSLKVILHPDYRKFLLEASDVVYGTLEPCTVTNEKSHTFLLEVARTAWRSMGLPRELLPICELDGDYFCINQKGQIIFWSHNGRTDESWPNLSSWIKQVWIGNS